MASLILFILRGEQGALGALSSPCRATHSALGCRWGPKEMSSGVLVLSKVCP